jgi:hypothetical protein
MSGPYGLCLRLADWWVARGPLERVAAYIVLVLAIVALNQIVLRDFPNSGDEYVYQYQARTLASGHWVNAAPKQEHSFESNYILFDDGRAYGVFPVGWPLALAAAIAIGIPIWLVNPLAGAATVFLVAYLASRLHSPRVGALAAAIVVVSPFFVFNAASYFSHTLCAALLLAAACIASREDRSPLWVPVTVGFFIGWAIVTRYFTGAICSTAIAAWLFRPGHRNRLSPVLLALGGLPWVLLLAVNNNVLNGNPLLLTTFEGSVSHWFAGPFIRHGADMTLGHLLRFVLWTPPLLLVLYGVYLWSAPPATRRGVLDWMLVIVATGFYCYIERGGNQYGPRFYYEAFPFVVIFVAANVFHESTFAEKSLAGRRLFALAAISVAVLPAVFAVHAWIEHRVVNERMDPFERSASAHVAPAILFIKGRVGTSRSMPAEDLTRNGTTYSGGVLFALDLGMEENCRTLTQYKGRSGFIYTWDEPSRSGSLRQIACKAEGPRTD